MSVIVKYSYHVTRGLVVKLQWYVYQNKVTVGFLEINFYSLGKVTSLLGEKSVFSVIDSKSLKFSLFDICRTRLEFKAWSPYIKYAPVNSWGAMNFRKTIFPCSKIRLP